MWSSANWSNGFSASPITRDELLRDLDKLDGWPEKVRTMQRNWIDRSEGAVVDFTVIPRDEDRRGPRYSPVKLNLTETFLEPPPDEQKISVFTTRIDTIYGVTSLLLAPEHPLVTQFSIDHPDLKKKVGTAAGGAENRAAKRATWQCLERGRRHRALRHQSFYAGNDSHLGRQLRADGLWDRRDHVGAGA